MLRVGVERGARVILAACCIAVLCAELAVASDLYAFEWSPLYRLLGPQGVAFVLLLNAGCLALLFLALGRPTHRGGTTKIVRNILILVAIGLLAWLLEWLFVETPLTYRVRQAMVSTAPVTLPAAVRDDFGAFSIVAPLEGSESRERLAVMYERIRLVNPAIHRHAPIGATIDRYAAKYQVDPLILFYLAYVHSFWGEAASGRVPLFDAMTAETVRDVVQIHLPAWFVEADLRHYLITSDLLERVAGPGFGFKLRYAVHKSTLDVSAQPFELNMLTDVMLVLREYPDEFPDVLGNAVEEPVKAALRDAFRTIGASALKRPYEGPYASPPEGPAYYAANRNAIKRFARASYYATALDFDLATRVAALLVDYQRRVYESGLGQERWQRLPSHQTAALLTMTRDVYVPNVGRPAYNVYSLPELNCTPVQFVLEQAATDPEFGSSSSDQFWRPRNYELLWGGAGTKLRVFSEVWLAARGTPFPGLEPEETISQARTTVLMQQSP